MTRRNQGVSQLAPFLFLAPAVVTLFLIGVFPSLFALLTSFRRYNLARAKDGFSFVGLENYAAVLQETSFWTSLATTARFYLVVMPLELSLGLLIALLLHKPRLPVLGTIARVSLVAPLATTPAVVGLIGRLIFNRDFGIANSIVALSGLRPIDWLGSASGAFAAIVLMDVWQWTPFCALIFLAGLAMVPVEIEEAVRLETRSAWVRLRHIQLPFLMPGLTAVLILRLADVLKLFDMVFVMTRGGPGAATDLISIYIQRVGFRVFDLGLAAAQAILLLVATIGISRFYIRMLYREAP
jgi:multiple sugar transport system permease protein